MKEKKQGRRAMIGIGLGVGALGAAAATGVFRPLRWFMNASSELPKTDPMPAIFVGHGTPRSAIEPNDWTRSWEELGQKLPRPAAILSISAHWLTQGASLVTANEAPRMNYDMYGFPQAMYQIVYPAPGHPGLAQEVRTALTGQLPVHDDKQWGFDHATWVVLKYMFPKADIPVIQLSIDYNRPPEFHYALGKYLAPLRSRGVLIFGSGNMVHNLNMRPGSNNNQVYGWAAEFDRTMATAIQEGNHQTVVDFQKLGSVAAQAHPTYDHFLPLLYCLGVKGGKDEIQTFNDNFQWPAVSMRSFVIA